MIDDILIKLTVLSNYFQTTRRAGHTEAVIRGAENSDCIVIVHSHNQLRHRLPPRHITVSVDDLVRLKGLSKPLVFDNFPLTTLFTEAGQEISKLRGEIIKLKKEKK